MPIPIVATEICVRATCNTALCRNALTCALACLYRTQRRIKLCEYYRSAALEVCGAPIMTEKKRVQEEPEFHTHPEPLPFDYNLDRWHLIHHNFE